MPLYLLSALLHLYVGWRIVPALGAWPPAQALLAMVLVASTVLLPLGLRSMYLTSPPQVLIINAWCVVTLRKD